MVDNDGIVIIDEVWRQEMLTKMFGEAGVSGAIVVNAHLTTGTSMIASMQGLVDGLDYLDDPRPMVVQSFFDANSVALVSNPHFHALMGRGSTTFQQMPTSLEDLIRAVQAIDKTAWPAHPVAKTLARVPMIRSCLSSLRHDFAHVRAGEDSYPTWLAKAQKAGLTGSAEEIVKLVEQGGRAFEESWKPLAGQTFCDTLFVDVTGTLEDGDGNLDHGVVAFVRHLSATMPVVIWTGEDVETAGERLWPHLPWPVTAKQNFRNVIIKGGIMIDDGPWEMVADQYGINFEWVVRWTAWGARDEGQQLLAAK